MLFGFDIGLGFAIVKINRVRFLYPVQAVLLVFARHSYLGALMLTYYGIPLVLRGLNQEYGLDWNINAIPAAVLRLQPLHLMRSPI